MCIDCIQGAICLDGGPPFFCCLNWASFGLSNLLQKLVMETWFQLLVLGSHPMVFAKRSTESENSVLSRFV